ncbi:metallophosphoesterase family protein [Faecalicatena sp. AGMB00832]|uniref:Metallophosphoesterase family protein n=1 Tax=Faecalicatena faecalis TaxID=2726362 RepID=A0ABS6D5V2_9FIRM|nr:metallophosphoesterase [Faecalicatena faecalis]MBU3876980.1 metallophosphoesterase family protein [Faecalicatena faecalis]
MSWYERITRAFGEAPQVPFYSSSRFVLISDCHRGCGNHNDNFLKNQNLYFAALNYYYEKEFSYVELGDGDELWENRSLSQIIDIHSDVFWLMTKFQEKNRLYLLYGNHDHSKQHCSYCQKHCSTYHLSGQEAETPLFPKYCYLQGLILKDMELGNDLYLTHGHQADFLNSTLAPVAKFLVRYVWKPLEAIGFSDPTSTAKNYTRKKKTESRLTEWAVQEQKFLVTGHTHRPMIGSTDSPYFNTGSCVHPRCITCMELQNRKLTLVKWTLRTREDRTLYVAREELGAFKL